MNVMEVNEEAVKVRLREENQEYQKLEQEHRRLDSELMSFETHVYLSPEEEFERRRMQKLKLAAKDRMRELIRQHAPGYA